MQHRILVVPPTLAQASPDAQSDSPSLGLLPMIFMGLSAVLLIALVGGGIYAKLELDKANKKVKFEDFKNKELQKKLKLALSTITKMEANPDLVHSREFNLDYLRMRMDEEVFHFAIVNQIKVKVKEQITIALRPTQAKEGKIGENNAASARKVSEVFDVTYETGEGSVIQKRVLFRIQINMTRLPTQATSKTIQDIIDCIETYLSPHPDPNWQPAIQGRLVNLHWDQKAKPTPLLVLEQLNEGSNVTFKTKTHAPSPTPPAGKTSRSSSSRTKSRSSGSRSSGKSSSSRSSGSRSRSQARRSK
ncbi:hypothetical protein PJF56_17295 [Roseofilum sp. BLCC_M91]|uniref:Uncharacterized protein n=1 Tax=Roseofilum halophilum BLCC-M91 TaxID=3022259 RepID=A0ABT7BN48_9CYAN|nr:hypothetical protein [Roseofilum halophilum]MDJ1180617.1 hypothetical protein [Roseofilum halophilum BLCC-M91]